MKEINIKYISVFVVLPLKNQDKQKVVIKGGSLKIDNEVNSIILTSFNGKLSKGIKLQPFHFNMPGNNRHNELREDLKKVFEQNNKKIKDEISLKYAEKLSKLIDNRTGELMLIFAFGEEKSLKRIVFWAFPHDEPIQLQTDRDIPRIAEIKNAFSKNSHLRKGAFFEVITDQIGRNDLIKGILVDTSAGKSMTASNYWLEGFLNGKIDMLPTRGTNQIIKGIKAAQIKAKTSEEKSSVKAAFYSILSGSKKNTTLNEISYLLVGDAKKEYLNQMPKSIENDARFTIDIEEAKKKIKSTIFILKNGIEVHFPNNLSIDADDYIEENELNRIMTIKEIIDEEIYK
ncbi:MAG: hypothetical protein PF693_18460 [Spirochaetia bacterium]|jgi:hypothetical protein|nr:hypothetical protein [Spirochaetia bacterium]